MWGILFYSIPYAVQFTRMRKLYLYMPARYLDNVLWNDELHLSLPEECNDVHELGTKGDLPPQIREQIERIGFICFSEDCCNTALWGHYADHHRGVCLEFEFPGNDSKSEVKAWGYGTHVQNLEGLDEEVLRQFVSVKKTGKYAAILMKVSYSPYISRATETLFGTNEASNKTRLRSFCVTKGQDWEYEREWRLFADRIRCLGHHNNQNFVKGLTSFLTRVILGTKCTLKESLVKATLDETVAKRKGGPVDVDRAKDSAVYDRIVVPGIPESETPWTVSVQMSEEQHRKFKKLKEQSSALSTSEYIIKALNL